MIPRPDIKYMLGAGVKSRVKESSHLKNVHSILIYLYLMFI